MPRSGPGTALSRLADGFDRILRRRANCVFNVAMSSPVTVIDDGAAVTLDAIVHGDAIRIAPDTLARAFGWKLELQGLCRGDTCVAVHDRAALVRDGDIDLAELARLLDRPLAMDAAEGVAALAAPAEHRANRLVALEAPDFTLPDLEGRLHSLHDHRGRRKLLIAWASW